MCNRKFPSFQALDNGQRLPPCSGAGKAKRVLYLRAGVRDRAGAWAPSHHRRKGRAEDRPSLEHSVGSEKRERLLDLSLTLAPLLSVLNLG
ncbi:hypothetical protein RHSIM_Rhsim04G0062500 [Rhododendron simsii]|uniref:Uncharacterized protein n=1 Tax=Rhododendron simsii TaxID=118357 RepID=A0A834LQ03_RHOSS|nr:hypothetical protein RHSIM_Rhsim05G0199200 [Rhododendron simsii]KAF7145158.1 hypothetical protein RHSIM_Rhsim04G0062500 [Rhododendron simsii]